MSGPLYECLKCSHTGPRLHMVEHFIRAHVDLTRAPWSCSLCGFKASSKQILLRHEGHFIHKTKQGEKARYWKSNRPYHVRIGQDIAQVQSRGGQEAGANGSWMNSRFDVDERIPSYEYMQGRPDMPVYDTDRAADRDRKFVYGYPNRSDFERDGQTMGRNTQFMAESGGLGDPRRNGSYSQIGSWVSELDMEEAGVELAGGMLEGVDDQDMRLAMSESILRDHDECRIPVNETLDRRRVIPADDILDPRRASAYERCNLNRRLGHNSANSGQKIRVERQAVETVLESHEPSRSMPVGFSKLTPERVPASSSTTVKPPSEKLHNVPESSSKVTPEIATRHPSQDAPNVESDRTCISSSKKRRRSSKSVDQSAEVGSTCNARDKVKPSTPARPEHKKLKRTNAQKEPVLEKTKVQLERVEDDTELEELQEEEEEEEEDQENRFLEEKVTELLQALDPLKNISKALIALDHHMRRLLPVIEMIAKSRPSPSHQ